jgi:hypothetical protein
VRESASEQPVLQQSPSILGPTGQCHGRAPPNHVLLLSLAMSPVCVCKIICPGTLCMTYLCPCALVRATRTSGRHGRGGVCVLSATNRHSNGSHVQGACAHRRCNMCSLRDPVRSNVPLRGTSRTTPESCLRDTVPTTYYAFAALYLHDRCASTILGVTSCSERTALRACDQICAHMGDVCGHVLERGHP